MKKIFLLLALVAVALAAEAQDEFSFGKIRKSELKKNDYHSSEVAVTLDEYVRIMPSLLNIQSFINDGQTTPLIVREVVARKVKILTNDEANNKIQISLKNISPNERENCEPHSVWANCYTLKNNRIIKRSLDIASIKRYKQADGSTFLEFEIPNVQQGSIIEYGYTKAIVTESLDYTYTMQNTNSRCEVAINEQYAHLFDIKPVGKTICRKQGEKKALSNISYSSSVAQAGQALSGVGEYNGPSLSNANTSRSSASTALFALYVFSTENLASPQGAEQNSGITITLKQK